MRANDEGGTQYGADLMREGGREGGKEGGRELVGGGDGALLGLNKEGPLEAHV